MCGCSYVVAAMFAVCCVVVAMFDVFDMCLVLLQCCVKLCLLMCLLCVLFVVVLLFVVFVLLLFVCVCCVCV